jgi:hypothetical protein
MIEEACQEHRFHAKIGHGAKAFEGEMSRACGHAITGSGREYPEPRGGRKCNSTELHFSRGHAFGVQAGTKASVARFVSSALRPFIACVSLLTALHTEAGDFSIRSSTRSDEGLESKRGTDITVLTQV